jgi:hypothetical protein
MAIRVEAIPNQLSWSDFQVVQTLPDNSGDDAQVAPLMPALSNIQVVVKGGVYSLPDLTLRLGLDRTQTMVVQSAQQTAYLLNHEQGHYDITKLTIRAMAGEMENVRATSAAELGRKVNDVLTRHQRLLDALTKKYDGDTKNSRDQTAQAAWDQAIRSALTRRNLASLQGLPL